MEQVPELVRSPNLNGTSTYFYFVDLYTLRYSHRHTCGESLFWSTHESDEIKTEKYNTLMGEANSVAIVWITICCLSK